MVEVRYVCEGTCGGMVTETQFKAGMNTCATKGCPLHGKALVQKGYCSKCKKTFTQGTKHSC